MKTVPKEFIDFLREQYPVGSRIRLREMKDDPHPLEPGSMGTLDFIDDTGTFQCTWDNGRSLGVVIGQDSFTVLAPEPTTLKLYMPLTAQVFEKNEWGDYEEDPTEELNSRELRGYEDVIRGSMERYRADDPERGFMEYYGEKDGVNEKVLSAKFVVEDRDGQLWGVAECRVAGSLTPLEKESLIEYVTGQASDGWGEGYEQQPIKLDDGEMYVSLWNGEDWSIQTEQERFGSRQENSLPDVCWSVTPDEGKLVRIVKGERECQVSEYNQSSPEKNRQTADHLNQKRGITSAQERAMVQSFERGWAAPTSVQETAEGLPEMCFHVLSGEGTLVCIKRGESGYYPSDWDTGDPVKNQEIADYNNQRLGVTKAQEEAMFIGSMVGWSAPGAEPKFYDDQGTPQMGGMTLG